MIDTHEQNSILSILQSNGCSLHTALENRLKEGGDKSSRIIAQNDLTFVQKVKFFIQAANAYSLSPALLAALASRESHCGQLLVNGWGDKHHAFGICQVDARSHSVKGADSYGLDHLMQVASIIADYWNQVKHKHSNWSDAQSLKGAVAAYNSGVANVDTIIGLDHGTTGNDYSSDVWSRSQFYAA